MAGPYAIAATSQALVALIGGARPRSEFASLRCELYLAKNFHDPMDDGVSVYLSRVMTSASRRATRSLDAAGNVRRPPALVDLQYLVTPWARDPVRQQWMLGWILRALEDTPVLTSGELNDVAPTRTVFEAGETVELVRESPSLADLTQIWEMAKHNQQPSLVVTARVLAITSDLPLTIARDVQTRVIDYGTVVES